MSNAPNVLFKSMPPTADFKLSTAALAAPPPALPEPDPLDARFSAFFIDLDAHTQYHAAYGNDSHYMDTAIALINGPAVKAWQRWAGNENGPNGPALRAALVNAASNAPAAAKVQEIDTLMLGLLRKHFPGTGDAESIDAIPFLGAMECFAKDRLPVDNDRLQRVGGGGDDVSHHRMDGFGMWFHWAAVFDCARFIPNGGGEKPYRSLLIASAAFGSAFDSAFRQRERTRPGYTNDPATDQRLRTEVMTWIQDGEVASSQARELFRIFMRVQ